MGHQLSAREKIERIAGDVFGTDGVAPTGATYVYVKHSYVPPDPGIYLGDPAEPIWHLSGETIEMELPDDEPQGFELEGVNYSGNHELPLARNEVIVPDSELALFNEARSEHKGSFQDSLYNAASVLHALDSASTYVEAALRDGVNVDIEPDKAIYSAFTHVSRLQQLCDVVEKMHMPAQYKEKYLKQVTNLLAHETVKAMATHDNGERARRMMDASSNLFHARVKKETGMEEAPTTTMGIRRSRFMNNEVAKTNRRAVSV